MYKKSLSNTIYNFHYEFNRLRFFSTIDNRIARYAIQNSITIQI